MSLSGKSWNTYDFVLPDFQSEKDISDLTALARDLSLITDQSILRDALHVDIAYCQQFIMENIQRKDG